MAEATGLEPTTSDLEADVLPIELHLSTERTTSGVYDVPLPRFPE
ncbi:14268_t:CDS:2 [Cetraspora pellucida]|uniref:14268_t:CDS:1 n=1 Tax=Cetraspora pellucida TaxID=1433469 RepID=A0ACA9KFZ7_9GLOM|nr:14268_t:CDS:2 [Cetraspora pellucida]